MSDREVIIRELEDAGWLIADDHGVFTAVHFDATAQVRFGGRYGWTLKKIRRDAAEALGQHTARATVKRRRITTAHVNAQHEQARQIYLNVREQEIEREQVRRRVINRDNELRDIARLMQPGR